MEASLRWCSVGAEIVLLGLAFVPAAISRDEPIRGWVLGSLLGSVAAGISFAVFKSAQRVKTLIPRSSKARVSRKKQWLTWEVVVISLGLLVVLALGYWGSGPLGALANLWVGVLPGAVGYLLDKKKGAGVAAIICFVFLTTRLIMVGLIWVCCHGPEVTTKDAASLVEAITRAIHAQDSQSAADPSKVATDASVAATASAETAATTTAPTKPAIATVASTENAVAAINDGTEWWATLAYAADESQHMPTSEQRAFAALKTACKASDVALLRVLEVQRERFEELVRAVDNRFSTARFGIQCCEIFLGRSFGMHQIIVVFACWSIATLAIAKYSLERATRLQNCKDAIQMLGLFGTVVGMSLFVADLAKPDPSGTLLQQGALTGDLSWKLALAFNKTATAMLAQLVLVIYASFRASDDNARRLWQGFDETAPSRQRG